MAEELLTIVIKTIGDDVPLSKFVKVLTAVKELLEELSNDMLDEPLRFNWAITKLSMESPPTIGVGLYDVPESLSFKRLQRVTIHGFDSLQNKMRPRDWNDKAMQYGRKLGELIDHKTVTGIALYNGDFRTEVTTMVIPAVDDFLVPVYKTSQGSIDGHLDMINAHKGVKLGIYRSLDDSFVRANFEGVDAKELLETAKNLLGKRVLAIGRIKWNKKGIPTEILVSSVKEYMEGVPGKSILDMYGSDPDFTGGVDPAEFLRRQRGDD